jgi:lysophospholipase L1-like esterase
MKIKRSFSIFLLLPLYLAGNAQQVFSKADSARWGSYWWHSKDMCDNHDLLRKELTIDGLHLNYDGYKIWAESIKPMLKK